MSHREEKKEKILAADAGTAVQEMISLTRTLLNFAEEEAQALVKGDLAQLTVVQENKEKLAGSYAGASQEFRFRIEEFRGTDRRLLDELEKLQNELGEKTENNNALISQIYQSALANTQKTLLSAQEMGQRSHMNGNSGSQEGV